MRAVSDALRDESNDSLNADKKIAARSLWFGPEHSEARLLISEGDTTDDSPKKNFFIGEAIPGAIVRIEKFLHELERKLLSRTIYVLARESREGS